MPRDYHRASGEDRSGFAVGASDADRDGADQFVASSIDQAGRGSSLQVTAYAPDGVIEAVEVPGRRFAIGVQWHPEWMFEDQPEHRRLFEGLVSGVNG